jgi:hypothetical protein
MASYDGIGHHLRGRLIDITSQPSMVAANASKAQSDGYSDLLDTHTVSLALLYATYAGVETDPKTAQ